MKNVPENELFSAYLDGELTAEEQAQVERVLADSPAARQLLDELRALSSTLQSLPEYKLDEDLSEVVLRHAEREILTRPVPSTPTQPSRRLPDWRRFLNSRSLAWSGTVVAVAVMLTVIFPKDEDRPAEVEVAKAPESVAANEIAVDRIEENPLVENRPVEETDLSADEMPTDGELGGGFGGGGGRSDQFEDSLPRRLAGTVMSGQPVDERGDPIDSFKTKSAGIDRVVDAPAQGVIMPGHGHAAAVAKGASPGSGADPATTPIASKGQGPGGYFAKGAVNVNGVVNARPGDGLRQTVTRDSGLATRSIDSKSLGTGGQLFAGVQLAQTAGGHAIVFCDISPEALRQKSFVRLLGANKISVKETAVRRNLQFKKKDGAYAARVELSKELDPEESQRDAGEIVLNRGREGEVVTLDEATIAQWGDAERFDVFYVEATAAQIKGVLSDLGQQPDTLLALSAEPDLGPRQQKREGSYEYRSTRGSGEDDEDRRVQAESPEPQVEPLARSRTADDPMNSDGALTAGFRGKGGVAGGGVAGDVVDKVNDRDASGGTVLDGHTAQLDGPQLDGPQLDGPQLDGQSALGRQQQLFHGQAPARPAEPGAETPQLTPLLEPETQADSPVTPPGATTAPAAITEQTQQAVQITKSAPSTPRQPADLGVKIQDGHRPKAAAAKQEPTEQEEIPGEAVRGGAGSGLANQAKPTVALPESDDDTAAQSSTSQSSPELPAGTASQPGTASQQVAAPQRVAAPQPAPNSQLGVEGLLPEEVTYRVLFVLRIGVGKSSDSANTAASIMASDAVLDTEPTPSDPGPTDQPAVEPSPAKAPPPNTHDP